MREVQDSDEEIDDVESEYPPHNAPAQSRGEGDPSQGHSTGSTESLRKALQIEHQAQFQTQPSQAEPQSSVSLPEAPNIRQKASTLAKLPQSQRSASSKQCGPVTYGKKSKSTFGSLQPGEAEFAATEANSGPLQEELWNLEGTMRENYAHHEPMAMFPEPSSTIANATQTQLLIMEALRAPAMLGMSSEIDVPRNLLPPEPSEPWSDVLKLTPGDPLCPSASSNPKGSVSATASTVPKPGGAGGEILVSPQSRRGSSVVQKCSPLRHVVAQEDSQPMEFTGRHAQIISVTNLTGSPKVSADASRTRDAPSSTPTSHGKRRIVASSEYDDEISIGLPREQYKPRPSRSRSLKADTQDTIDYSIIPERAKKMPKRRKTAHALGSVEIPTTPEKLQQICEMGFTPNTTKEALQQNNGDVTSTVDWLVTNRIGEDELASHITPKKKPITPKSRVSKMDPEEHQIIMRGLSAYCKDDPPQSDAGASVIENSNIQQVPEYTGHANDQMDAIPVKSSRVGIVIPKNSLGKTVSTAQEPSEPPKKKAKRRKTTLDQPESEQPTTSLELSAPVSVKKRGRGRPKKIVEVATATEEVQKAPTKSLPEEQPHEVLQAVELNAIPGETPVTDPDSYNTTSNKAVAIVEEPVVATAPLKADNQSIRMQTPETPLKSATPSTKGKVPYRVGLSKRARIAPLLRVLKK
ncbi:hypothetical protein NX059_002651 [Plenodomus lindquistii]|nr:hypothetical protein NX059_002651 [Plenodomus lindquistii]